MFRNFAASRTFALVNFSLPPKQSGKYRTTSEAIIKSTIIVIILLILRSFQRKGLCNSGLKAKSTTFVRNITTIRLRSQFVILKMNINMTDITEKTDNGELVTNCDQLQNDEVVVTTPVESRIMSIRGKQIMIDRDLAELYGVETRVLNQAVKRNMERFPERFRFQLTKEEMNELVTNCDRFNSLKHSTVRSYAFTEQGVAMLSTVLRSETAIRVSIRIMDAFVAMRRFMVTNAEVFQRLSTMEYHQLEMQQHLQESDKRIDEVFRRLDKGNAKPKQGVFYNGQIYDAYTFVSDLIKSAKKRIVLIDNYVDETVLTLLDKRDNNVSAIIYTQQISRQFQLDIDRHNAQYAPIDVETFRLSHDRFLCIDDDVYHIGASIKDLGKKWFGFSKMEILTPDELVERINRE